MFKILDQKISNMLIYILLCFCGNAWTFVIGLDQISSLVWKESTLKLCIQNKHFKIKYIF